MLVNVVASYDAPCGRTNVLRSSIQSGTERTEVYLTDSTYELRYRAQRRLFHVALARDGRGTREALLVLRMCFCQQGRLLSPPDP